MLRPLFIAASVLAASDVAALSFQFGAPEALEVKELTEAETIAFTVAAPSVSAVQVFAPAPARFVNRTGRGSVRANLLTSAPRVPLEPQKPPVTLPSTPVPASMPMLLIGLVAGGLLLRRRRG